MYLLDTNVVSELRKAHNGKANVHVVAWANAVEASDMFLSVITIQELEIGVLLAERRDAAQGGLLRAWLETQVIPAFAGRLLPVTTEIARRSAQLHVPNPQPVRDGLIAATGLVHNLVVVTRNAPDLTTSAVALLNPWNTQVTA